MKLLKTFILSLYKKNDRTVILASIKRSRIYKVSLLVVFLCILFILPTYLSIKITPPDKKIWPLPPIPFRSDLETTIPINYVITPEEFQYVKELANIPFLNLVTTFSLCVKSNNAGSQSLIVEIGGITYRYETVAENGKESCKYVDKDVLATSILMGTKIQNKPGTSPSDIAPHFGTVEKYFKLTVNNWLLYLSYIFIYVFWFDVVFTSCNLLEKIYNMIKNILVKQVDDN